MKRYEFFCCTIFYNLSQIKGENQFGPLQGITFHQPTTVDKEPELLHLSERRQVVLNDMVALLSLYQSMTSYGQFLASQKPQRHLSLANWDIFVAFSLPIKSTLLLALAWDTINLGTFSLRNTSLNEVIPMPEKSCSSAFTTSLQLVIPIPAISLTFMRNEKDNRQ